MFKKASVAVSCQPLAPDTEKMEYRLARKFIFKIAYKQKGKTMGSSKVPAPQKAFKIA